MLEFDVERREALEHVRAERVSGVAQRLIGELIGTPIMRAGQVSARHDVSHQAAMNALRRLAHIGIVTEQNRKGRVSFAARRVVELIRQ